ncbi:endochitinase A-like isoform X2 [Salvia miltiorrhiza]|uniref:endochitinase A-like isoform X2 n=1 Tax=Salvia miltiorrhiza TaxID=226208 RepID=UPI0025AD593C|nr:endochitinase A-like isoform X2 [Salvia miltiorrhiza]
MATSVQFRPHNRDLGMVVREVDEDLAIFLGMKNGEKERIVLAHIDNFEEFDGSTSAEPMPDSFLLLNGLGEEAFQSLADDSLLNLETGKNDHEWLLAQQDAQDLAANQADASSGECISLNSELPKSNNLGSSASANRRPLSSGGRKPSSRAATPNRRPALPAKLKPRASTPTSRAASKPAAAAAAASAKPVASQVRTSTPSRAAPRSSTPTSRATTPAASSRPASTSRASTTAARSCSAAPTRKPATPSTTSSKSPSDGASSRGKKSSIVATKNPVVPTRGGCGSSSRLSNPSEMLSVSHDAPQSVKTSMPKRPASASRGRPSAISSPSKGKPRQKSCSPTKTRATVGNAYKNGSTTLSRSRGYSSRAGGGGGDDVNPVLMGTKMVERVVNSRKLAPPKQDELISVENPKRSSHENSGFGRSLSKKSLDMAIRHMDIRRSVNSAGSLRPVATSAVLSYFSNGNQSSSSQSSSFGVSESPVTSCSDSSKSSNGVSSYFS